MTATPPVALAPVAGADRAALLVMLEPYLDGLRGLTAVGRGQTDYPFFDAYWSEPARRPYWILDSGERAGFALVSDYSPSGLGTEHAVSEFHVLPDRQGRGVGLAAALALFRSHPGQWELHVAYANAPATRFWRRAIAAAGGRDWERLARTEHMIHRFRTGAGLAGDEG